MPRVEDTGRRLFGLQFHPEVAHTQSGKDWILENFLYRICGCKPDWTMGSFIEESCQEIRIKYKITRSCLVSQVALLPR